MFRLDSNDAMKNRIGGTLKPLLELTTPVLVGPLEVGDLSFIGRDIEGQLSLSFGFEFKQSPSDLVGSLRDGRLVSELIRMLDIYDSSYLCIVGHPIRSNFKSGKIQERRRKSRGESYSWVDSPFSYHYLNSTLARFEAAGGKIRYSQDIPHLAVLLLSLHSYWRKEGHKEEMFIKKRYPFLDWRMLDNPLAEMYERMGIGIKRGVVLAEKAPTLESLCLMTKGELRNLPGFGTKTVEKIMEIIHGEV